MKLVKIRDENLTENYIELHYNKMDDETEHIIYLMNQSLDYLDGMVNGQKVAIRIEDILYCEVVDRKIFSYTEKDAVEIKIPLRDLLEKYEKSGFIQVGKSVLVNAYKIKSLKGDLNMRVAILLQNGEVIIMNRSFRSAFYQKLKELHGQRGNE